MFFFPQTQFFSILPQCHSWVLALSSCGAFHGLNMTARQPKGNTLPSLFYLEEREEISLGIE